MYLVITSFFTSCFTINFMNLLLIWTILLSCAASSTIVLIGGWLAISHAQQACIDVVCNRSLQRSKVIFAVAVMIVLIACLSVGLFFVITWIQHRSSGSRSDTVIRRLCELAMSAKAYATTSECLASNQAVSFLSNTACKSFAEEVLRDDSLYTALLAAPSMEKVEQVLLLYVANNADTIRNNMLTHQSCFQG